MKNFMIPGGQVRRPQVNAMLAPPNIKQRPPLVAGVDPTPIGNPGGFWPGGNQGFDMDGNPMTFGGPSGPWMPRIIPDRPPVPPPSPMIGGGRGIPEGLLQHLLNGPRGPLIARLFNRHGRFGQPRGFGPPTMGPRQEQF